jgi:transketolase
MIKNSDNFSTIAKNIRRNILSVSYTKKSPHIGSSLSCVEILIAAYNLKLRLEGEGTTQCKVVFSKGHASLAVYCTLVELGMLPLESLDQYNEPSSHYYGHVSHKSSPYVELSTGSLGHGLPFALGLALANKLNLKVESPVIVIISDGECDEGTTWESALLANQFQLSNLIVVVDRNRLQSLATTEQTLKLEPFGAKWESFGWDVFDVNGHDTEMLTSLMKVGIKPRCIIANTKKGRGVSFMENSIAWHYKSPTSQELTEALKELEVFE